jgi:hypothetical protein
MKHTTHSRERLSERGPALHGKLRVKLRKREFIGLPRVTVHKRVALVPLDDEPMVVVWMKSTEKIITVLTLKQYMERHGHELRPRLLEKIKRDYPKHFTGTEEKENELTQSDPQ